MLEVLIVQTSKKTNKTRFFFGKMKVVANDQKRHFQKNSIMGLLPCGSGVAAATQDPALGLIDTDGMKRAWRESVTANFRDEGQSFLLSNDGRRLSFNLDADAERLVTFDLSNLTTLRRP